jgi:hypothetical protein
LARVAEIRSDGQYLLDWDDGDAQDRVKPLNLIRVA